ncbi:hypothetical protein V1294_006050 [Bradyrhizobium sp. AZCC 1678]|uniref:hypothetical protein n=1 Tax=Bradyrhizobium sp. AZCC 1678 TaxID=3117030 RepID=UPI002FF20512
MFSIAPTSADIVSAVPTDTFVLPGGRYDAKPAEAHKPIRRNVSRKRTGQEAYFKTEKKPTLLAKDIPFDDGPPVYFPHVAPKPKFVHKPIITHRRGDVVTVVTGPIEPTVPHTTPATEPGWKKWFGDVTDVAAAAKKAGVERAAKRRGYFKGRSDKKEAEWEARCKRALAKGKPLPKRPKPRELPPNFMHYVKDEQFVAMVNASRATKSTARRMREFWHRGSMPIADRVYADFNEFFEHADGTAAPAIRSWLRIISLSLLNSSLPRGWVNYGYNKEVEYSSSLEGRRRLFVLDESYIVLDKSRRCAFIVDLDGWWESVAGLRAQLRKLLPSHLMPNIITFRGRECDGLGVENPHLVWMLPPGSRVLRGKGKKKDQQFKLHSMIQAGIVSLLIELGADPGHTNIFKTKNPLSPSFSIETCDDHFATMDDWRAALPTITPNKREMQRRAKVHKASQQSGAKVNLSLAIWNDGIAFRRLEIKAAQRRKDSAFLQAIKKNATFVDWLYHPVDGVVTNRLIKEHSDTLAVRSVLKAQRDFVVQMDLTPSAIGEFCNRGRDYYRNQQKDCPVAGPMATAEERKRVELYRKSQGGTESRLNMKDLHCGLIAEEIELRMDSGIQVVKAEVVNALAKAGTVSRSVAYAHFDHVLKTVLEAARYQDHLLSNKSEQSGKQSNPSHVIVPDPESCAQSVPVAAPTPVHAFDPVRNPGKTTDLPLPAWVVDKDSLTEFEEACRIRDDWRVAVAAWRSAKHRQQADEGVDLADDPAFRAMVLERSAWVHHRRH